MAFDWGIALGVAGVAIGLPALVMAVSPFCKMIWGRPKLKIEFVDFTGTDGKDLMCSIFNEPISNRFLKLVGVTRDTGDLNASFDLIEEGSRRLLLRAITALVHDATTRESALVVRARPLFHSGFSIILCRERKTFVHDPRQQKLIHPVSIGRASSSFVTTRRTSSKSQCSWTLSQPGRFGFGSSDP